MNDPDTKIAKEVNDAIETIRKWQADKQDIARILIWDKIRDGYCVFCGRKTTGRYCYCTWDD